MGEIENKSKFEKFKYAMGHPSEITQLEMSRAFMLGSIIAVIGADISIIAFMTMPLITKIFIGLGGICGAGMLAVSLKQVNMQRKNYIDTQAEIEKMKAEAEKVISAIEQTVEETTQTKEDVTEGPKSVLVFDEASDKPIDYKNKAIADLNKAIVVWDETTKTGDIE